MYFKNLILAASVLTTACEKKSADKVFIDSLWKKTVQVTGASNRTKEPYIAIMDEDLYQTILMKDCEFENGEAQKTCLAERKKLEDSTLKKTGKDYTEVYVWYINLDRMMARAECLKFRDNPAKRRCVEKFLGKPAGLRTLGRTYARNNYIEIYRNEIQGFIRYLPISSGAKNTFYYGIIAHEMIHAALISKGAPALDHHRLMRDKYIGPLMDFISDHEKTDRSGFERMLILGSIETGIALDEKKKEERGMKTPCKPIKK